MTTTNAAVANAVDAELSKEAAELIQTLHAAGSTDAVLDDYGRDAAERTIELASPVAEAIDRVVAGTQFDDVLVALRQQYEGGSPRTYDDGLGYIVYRGMSEIKRQHDAAKASKAKQELAITQKLYKSMLQVNPALVDDPKFVAKMLAAFALTH